MKLGKVYLVGAGPGDPRLLTLRGRDCLAVADVVIADYLVHSRVLDFAKPTAEIIVRPKGRRGPLGAQGEIQEVMLARAQAGQTVVRLKGGDPFIFGRGGEEAEFLASSNIPYEVVPGITAALGAAAYAGIPLTHRGVSGVVAFVTGHEADQSAHSEIDWQAVASGATTLVLYMSVQRLPEVAEKLLAGGRSADESVAIVENGTLSSQRVVNATIGTMAKFAREAHVSSPALTIVGPVLSLRPKLDWFFQQQLSGWNVLVFSSKGVASDLETRGAEVEWFSPLDVVEHFAAVKSGLGRLPEFPVIAFTSQHAVDVFMGALFSLGRDVRALGGHKIVSIGDSTSEHLFTYGIRPDLSSTHGGEMLAETIVAAPWSAPVFFPCAKHAHPAFVDRLRQSNLKVEEVVAYETLIRTEALGQLWQRRVNWHAIAFTSPKGVDAFFDTYPATDRLTDICFAAIGATTADALRAHGIQDMLVASRPSVKLMVSELLNALCRGA